MLKRLESKSSLYKKGPMELLEKKRGKLLASMCEYPYLFSKSNTRKLNRTVKLKANTALMKTMTAMTKPKQETILKRPSS